MYAFSYSNLLVLLVGCDEVSALGLEAFERALEDFYYEYYNKNRRGRRLQLQSEVTSLDASVTVTSQFLSDQGNAITYNMEGNVSKTNADIESSGIEAVLLQPFDDASGKQAFLAKLKNRSSEFASAISVDEPVLPSQSRESDDKKDGLSFGLIFGNVLDGLCLCCCCAVLGYSFLCGVKDDIAVSEETNDDMDNEIADLHENEYRDGKHSLAKDFPMESAFTHEAYDDSQ